MRSTIGSREAGGRCVGVRGTVMTALLLVSFGCRVGQEGDRTTAKVHARNQELQREVAALRLENEAQRAELLGHVPWEQTIQVGRVGGAAGLVPFARVCPKGEAVIGFAGRVGNVIDALAPLCALLDRSSLKGVASASPVETELLAAGGNGGTPFRSVCPAGSHVVGLRGRAGAAIDQIEPQCQDTSWIGAQTSPPVPPRPTTAVPKVGGGGGGPYETRCPAGWVVVGVSGRSADLVHSLALRCGKLPGT